MGGAVQGDTYRNVLYENPGHGNSWLKLKLIGQKANRAAIGARLKLSIANRGTDRNLHRVVGSGGSFGASPLRQEIGLANADRIDQLEILWPGSGTRQVLTNLPIKTLITIREGETNVSVNRQSPTPFRKRSAHHHH